MLGEEFKNCADISIISSDNITNIEIIQNKTNSISTTFKLLKTTKTQEKTTNNYINTSKSGNDTNKVTKININDKNINLTTTKSLIADNETTYMKNVTSMQQAQIKPLYACSNHEAPVITIDNQRKKFNGLMVICFKSKDSIEIDCELCKNKCISRFNDCPKDKCQCLWY
jgi:hypothetical protein